MGQEADEEKRGNVGWVKISRAIQEHWVWDEKPFSRGQAWIDLILMAKHSNEKFLDRRGKLVDGERGHIYRSERSLAERWGWSRKKVSGFLSQLVQDNMIEISKKRASERTTIFIVNYNEFQSIGDSKRASQEPVRNQSRASEEPVGNIYKNDKNVKNEKEEKDIVAPAGSTSSLSFGSDSFEMQCVEYLISSCVETCPKSKVPDSPEKKQKWAVEIEKMKRLDGLSEEEIRQALQYAVQDGFWKANIRSTKKFREKFETLYSQSQNSRVKTADDRQGRSEEKFGRKMQ